MGIDATTKIPPETEHEWGEPLKSDIDTAAMVERRWQEYGLADLQLGEVDPNLFGYDMK
jgi:4-hydroxy-3-polyprenylbenzoate decarboxylase